MRWGAADHPGTDGGQRVGRMGEGDYACCKCAEKSWSIRREMMSQSYTGYSRHLVGSVGVDPGRREVGVNSLRLLESKERAYG